MQPATTDYTGTVASKATVLFVDDEPRVLTSMRAMFRRIYKVKTADSATAALKIMAEHHVDVVVSDQRMPGMTGVEFLAQLKTEYPNCMRILLTGYADLEAIEASINEGEVFRYLVKPCPPIELKRVVELAVDAARAELALSATEPTGQSQPAPADVAKPLAPVGLRVADVAFDEAAEYPVLTQQVPKLVVPVADVPVDLVSLDAANSVDAPARVDALVLSRDEKLHESVAAAMADELDVHHANFLDEALDLMAAEPIGVLITDLAVNEHEVSLMTRELKQQVPQLVTILAAERSDANLLIDLINQGQVFRFLLKPVPQAQCRIWLRSAVGKHRQMLASPVEMLRHVVDESPEDSAVSASHASAATSVVPDHTAGVGQGLDLRSLLAQKSAKVAARMGNLVDESNKAIDAVRASAPARSISSQLSALKQRISQWKASHE